MGEYQRALATGDVYVHQGPAVFVGGDSGKLVAARVYDDADPLLSAHTDRTAAG